MKNVLFRFSSDLPGFVQKHIPSHLKKPQLKKYHAYTLWENPFKLRKILITLFLLILPLLIFTSYHIFTKSSLADTTRSYDVVVVGGGTGGVSAAIQAARSGASVALIEEADWVGGQMTAAGVGTLDEGMDWSTNPAIGYERSAGIYKEFLDQVTARYGGIQNMHKCYYGNFAICFEPKVGQDILSGMLSSAGVQVFTRNKVTSALKSGNSTVVGVIAHNNVTNSNDQFNAKVVIDATEYGDVIPLTGAAYRVGRSTSGGIDMNAPIQDITYTAVIKRYDGGIPGNLQITTEPPGYQAAKARFAQFLSPSAPPRDWGDGVTSPYTNPRSWAQYIAYRGMADSTRASATTAQSYAQAATITKTGINLGNDYPATVRFLEDPANRTQVSCEAKLKTIQMLYYIQHEMGQYWSVDTDEAFDTSYNQSQNSCANIPAAFKEIEKRMPLIPYVRESRRIIGTATMSSGFVKAQKSVNRLDNAAVNAVDDASSIALGGYTTDLHCTNGGPCTQDQFDGSVDNVADMSDAHSLFQVPMGALIPQTVDGFLAAEKNISQGRIANGATRLQPITMLTGQAAGALAALAAKTNRQPRSVPAIEVQRVLLAANDPLTLYKLNDVPQGSAFWTSIHLASLYGIMTGNGGTFSTAENLDRGTTAIVLTRIFAIATNGTVDDAINKLREHGMTTAATNADFGAGNPLLKGQLALFMARGMGQNPGSATEAINFLSSKGISVGCSGGACENDGVSRGQMAEAVATSIGKVTANNPVLPPGQASRPPQLTGWQDYVTPTGDLVGWACDTANNTSPVRIDIYIDGGGFGQFIGQTMADKPGDDSSTLAGLCGGGSGNRRYIFPLPDFLRNAGTHHIYTYAVSAGDVTHILVPNSGQPFALGNKDPFGYPDYVDTTGRALGWVCDPDDFNQAITVHFYLDGPAGQGTFIGQATANIPDEKSVGYYCNGVNAHRFAWALPASALSGTHQLYVYGINIGTGSTQLLGGGPISTSDRHQAPPGL